MTRPLEWTREEINQFYEAEVAMANVDRIVKETADMRNELESYIHLRYARQGGFERSLVSVW